MNASPARILAILLVGQVVACSPTPTTVDDTAFSVQQNSAFRPMLPWAYATPEPREPRGFPRGPGFGDPRPPGPGSLEPGPIEEVRFSDPDEEARRADQERYERQQMWRYVRQKPRWDYPIVRPSPQHKIGVIRRPPLRPDQIMRRPSPRPTPPVIK